VSSKNHPFAPDTWAVVTQELKTAVDGRPGSPLKIVGAVRSLGLPGAVSAGLAWLGPPSQGNSAVREPAVRVVQRL